MDRPPRSRREPLFSGAVVRRIVFLGLLESVGACALFFWRVHSAGLAFDDFTTSTPAYREAITLTHAAIVLGQFFVAFTVRSDRDSILRVGPFSNRRLVGAALVALAVIAAISYVPALQSLFHTAALSATDWLLLVAFGLLVIVADELRKVLLRRREIGVAP
jgi:magnesium-transporting ATPase (P-type)